MAGEEMPPTVSLTMIVRNEEANLPGCLASCAGLFDELIIVDTGSTDRTKEIAAAHTDKHGRPARAFDFTWCDDFAAARNESVRHATGDWVFWMDADERISNHGQRALWEMFANTAMMQASVFYTVPIVYISPGGKPTCSIHRARLVPRLICRWSRRLFESIDEAPGISAVPVNATILHSDYPSNVERDQRNIRIARDWANDCPNDPDAWIALAVSYGGARMHERAIDICDKLLGLVTQDSNPEAWARVMEVRRQCEAAIGATSLAATGTITVG